MVIQVFGGAKNACAQFTIDVGPVINNAGHRAYGYPRTPGDISNCYGGMAGRDAATVPREPFHQISMLRHLKLRVNSKVGT
jgi:hypothetical protein